MKLHSIIFTSNKGYYPYCLNASYKKCLKWIKENEGNFLFRIYKGGKVLIVDNEIASTIGGESAIKYSKDI